MSLESHFHSVSDALIFVQKGGCVFIVMFMSPVAGEEVAQTMLVFIKFEFIKISFFYAQWHFPPGENALYISHMVLSSFI